MGNNLNEQNFSSSQGLPSLKLTARTSNTGVGVDEFPVGMPSFQVLCWFGFREGVWFQGGNVSVYGVSKHLVLHMYFDACTHLYKNV